MMKLRLTSAGVLAAVLLAGCASSVKLDETPIESRTPVAVNAAAGGAAAAGGSSAAGQASATAAQSQVATGNLPAAGGGGGGTAVASAVASGSAGRLVYFDFDSFVIDPQYTGLIEGHARQLAANRNKRLVIEGHTDERGGREYNLALGQKRAAAVAKSMALLGATDAQVEAVSFGKERPANEGHDEAAWAQNRRAEIKDR